MDEYDLRYKRQSKTLYTKRELLKEFVPSLMLTWCLRKFFKIKGGVGKIKNMDETMTYFFHKSTKHWTNC